MLDHLFLNQRPSLWGMLWLHRSQRQEDVLQLRLNPPPADWLSRHLYPFSKWETAQDKERGQLFKLKRLISNQIEREAPVCKGRWILSSQPYLQIQILTRGKSQEKDRVLAKESSMVYATHRPPDMQMNHLLRNRKRSRPKTLCFRQLQMLHMFKSATLVFARQ